VNEYENIEQEELLYDHSMGVLKALKLSLEISSAFLHCF
jgi:hypothetical protein